MDVEGHEVKIFDNLITNKKKFIEQISNSDIFYNLNNTIFTKNMPKDLSHDSLRICIKQKHPFPWDKRIQEIK